MYGKIMEITRNATASDKVPTTRIRYTYDVRGNRISQVVEKAGSSTKDFTWYVRDAQGNIITTYKASGNVDTATLSNLILSKGEQIIYGGNRLGSHLYEFSVDGGPSTRQFYSTASFERGWRQYELSNHSGNVLTTISDKKNGVSSGAIGTPVDYYEPEMVSATDYYPFGMVSRLATSSTGKTYRFGFNGQEMDNEIKGFGNMTTATYWEYDARIGRRWNLDPKPTVGVSLYSTFFNNPIWFNDKLGDSSVVDNRGYVLHYDPKDKDLRVFMQNGKEQTLIGELGKRIDANGWLKNLLQDNSVYADVLIDPAVFGDNFKNRVQQDGVWDYKYRSSANKDKNTKKLAHHILGIAFQRKDKDAERGVGDLPETYFTFDGKTGRAEDINNFHFGVVGKAFGFFLFTEEVLLRTAGSIEQGKWKKDYEKGKHPTPQVPASWRPTIEVTRTHTLEHGIRVTETESILLPPYGDNPVDHDWIKKGFEYFKAHKRELVGGIFK